MKIIDNVYGEEEIIEPVLVDLINSRSLQRLKGISQFGVPDEYYHKKNFSRYEHSLGVLILLRRLGADLNEQVAGLLHDVSHTAFSHVVDWFIGDPTKEDYQDKNHLDFIKKSELPFILKKYDIDYEEVSGLQNFSLLDTDAPSLCVDRIDYALRELKEDLGLEFVKKIFANLNNVSGQVVFFDEDVARLFADNYMLLQREHWSGEQAKARYHLLSEVLRIGVDKKIISMEDLMKTDSEVIGLLLQSNNQAILRRLDLLKKGFNIVESSQGIELKKKFRYIDPEVLHGDSIKPLSKLSQDYFNFIEDQKKDLGIFKKIMIIEK